MCHTNNISVSVYLNIPAYKTEYRFTCTVTTALHCTK